MTQRGILKQFTGANVTLYATLFTLSLARELFWLFSEVLEATGNPAEEAQIGRGFYSPEGFPFSNM
jgi:hypothetical protein